ncbi:tripartite motif-containing protein 5-like [Ylistrum balloti]|uniref:tripartite motif-containing protein 5-like n=1 Tax=Ylistrum balloti TaxID=509963 RepID=UPI002905957C|nr:tripartite motif-containing protein 5-like [Ylistrum balloti]
MAEGGRPLDLYLLECPICLERFQQPKSLPCLHSFCQDCLGTYITQEICGNTATTTSFPCPVCRKITSLVSQEETKEQWAEQFPTNTVIQDLIQLKERSPEPLYCKPCQTKGNPANPAKFWCQMMNVNLCETCKEQYHDILHSDCNILDISEYHIRQTAREQLVPKCDQHNEKMVWYCDDHRRLGCNVCMIRDHRPCGAVMMATEYLQSLKVGSKRENIEAGLKRGVQVLKSLVKDFNEQLQSLVHNQESSLQSITNQRENIDKQLNKLQVAVTDDLVKMFKDQRRDKEASLQQCERLMNGMTNTLKSSVTAIESDNATEAITLYHRGQAEVESCKALITEMSKSYTSVSIKHKFNPRKGTLGTKMGEIALQKRHRQFPCDLGYLSEYCVKQIRKIDMTIPSDEKQCWLHGVVHLSECIVVSDTNNRSLKLFTVEGKYQHHLILDGIPRDMCLMNKNTLAVAVSFPDGIRVVKVEDSKLSPLSNIDLSIGVSGITYTNGRFVVGTYRGVFSLAEKGGNELLLKLSSPCLYLACGFGGDTVVSIKTNKAGNVAVSRLSADNHSTNVLKVGVVRDVMGIDVDRKGNIFVCGRESNNVVQISGDGKRVRELLTSHEIRDPMAISICDDKFVVTDESNYIRIFQL